jgi:hypothetical protein
MELKERTEWIIPLLIFCVLFVSLFPVSLFSQVREHPKIILRGLDGIPLTVESKIPYSPKKTCGECHDYFRITDGYHFQQGRTDGKGNIVISDLFDPEHPWNLSSGMFGKH